MSREGAYVAWNTAFSPGSIDSIRARLAPDGRPWLYIDGRGLYLTLTSDHDETSIDGLRQVLVAGLAALDGLDPSRPGEQAFAAQWPPPGHDEEEDF